MRNLINRPEDLLICPDDLLIRPDRLLICPDELIDRPDSLLIRPDELINCPDRLINRPDDLLNYASCLLGGSVEKTHYLASVIEYSVSHLQCWSWVRQIVNLKLNVPRLSNNLLNFAPGVTHCDNKMKTCFWQIPARWQLMNTSVHWLL